MYVQSAAVYLLYFLTFAFASDSSHDIVDPTGWNYDRATKSSRNKVAPDTNCSTLLEACQTDVDLFCKKMGHCEDVNTKAPEAVTKEIPCNCKDNSKVEQQFMKRFINLLLNAAHISSYEVAHGGPGSGLVDITVTEEDLEILLRFADPNHDITLHQLDAVMHRVINSGLHMSKEYFTWMDTILYTLSRIEVWLGAGAFCVFTLALYLLLSGHRIAGIFTIFFMLIFMATYIMEFYKAFEEAKVEQMTILEQNPEIPWACRPADMIWYQSLWNSLRSSYQMRSNECQEYYLTLKIDPMAKLSPNKVLSNIAADYILGPAKEFGDAIAFFSAGVLVLLTTAHGIFLLLLRLLGNRIRFNAPMFGINVDIGGDNTQEDARRVNPLIPVAWRVLHFGIEHLVRRYVQH